MYGTQHPGSPEIKFPWELRFGEKFKGPNIPFGARIDYWTGPKLKPKKDLRFDPTSNPGIFLGYAMQPGFIWRNEFLVASLKDLMEKDFNESVQVVRVNQLTVPDGPFVYPLKGRYKAIREGLYESLSLELMHLQTQRRWMHKPSKTWFLRRKPSHKDLWKVKRSSRS